MQRAIKQTIKTNKSYFLTLTVTDWVDVFSRKNHRDAIIDSMRYCQEHKGLVVFAYVIMTNHVHMIVNTREPYLLKDVIRDLKKYTAKKILEQIKEEPESRREWLLSLFRIRGAGSSKHTEYKFWQEGNHAIELFNQKFLWDKINYIHKNPVRSGLVNESQHWIYSSASNYYGTESILEIECLSQPLKTV